MFLWYSKLLLTYLKYKSIFKLYSYYKIFIKLLHQKWYCQIYHLALSSCVSNHFFWCNVFKKFPIMITFGNLCKCSLSFHILLSLNFKYIVACFFTRSVWVQQLHHGTQFYSIHLLMNYICAWEGIFRNILTENDLSSIISTIRQLKFPLE